MCSCQKHQRFDSLSTTRSVKSTNASYITVFLPSRNVWSGYNSKPIPKQAFLVFSSLIVPVKQIQIMKLQMPVLNPSSWWSLPFESWGPNTDLQQLVINLPYLEPRSSAGRPGDRAKLLRFCLLFPFMVHMGETGRRVCEAGLCPKSNGRCYCHIHISEAIVVLRIPKA